MSPALTVTLLVLGILFIPPLALIAYYKLRSSAAIKKEGDVEGGRVLRKYKGADVNRQRSLYLRGTLALALGAILVAFAFTPPDKRDLGDAFGIYSEDIEMEPPPTTQPPPPEPPPPPPPDIEIIENPDEPEEPEDLTFDDPEDNLPLPELPPPPIEKEPEVTKPLRFVEELPEFPGGEVALMRFLNENIRYPAMARENNIEGTVHVEFVVGADGSVSDIKILRGLPGGCDAEVIRVLKIMPKWKPGRQTGRAVPVYYNLPVVFKLSTR